MNFFDRGNGVSGTQAATGIVFNSDDAQVVLPDQFDIKSIELEREGADLVISAPNSEPALVTGYFASANPPAIVLSNAMSLPAHIVEKMAGPVAPHQYAQAGAAQLAEPIGKIETVEGTVEVLRADGTRVTLAVGDPVYQGDELITAKGAAVGLVFADESTFALGEDGRMVLDEMVYDPGNQDGQLGVTLLTGAMTFVSGAVAKVNPDAMQITTPVATIGIRGTGGIIKNDGEKTQAALIAEGDGAVGEISITAPNGDTVTINVENGFVSASSAGLTPIVIGTVQDMLALGGNGLVMMSSSGLISQEITSAAQQAQDKLDAQVQVEVNAAENADAETVEVLNDLADVLQNTQFDIVDFIKQLQKEIEVVEQAVVKARASFGQFDIVEKELAAVIQNSSQAAAVSIAGVNKLTNAVDQLDVSSSLDDIGVSDTAGVMNVLFAGSNSMNVVFSISTSAISVAETAISALYATGDRATPAELSQVAAKIQEVSSSLLVAAQNAGTYIDAIITVEKEHLNYVLSNYKATIDGDQDVAIKTYLATNDDDDINAILNNQNAGFTLADLDTLLNDSYAKLQELSSLITELQTARADNTFLSGLKDIVSGLLTTIYSGDATLDAKDFLLKAETLLTNDTFADVATDSDVAKDSGEKMDELRLSLSDGSISTYQNTHITDTAASVLDTIALSTLSVDAQKTALAAAISNAKANGQMVEAVRDFISGAAQTLKTDAATAVNTANTNYNTASTDLIDAVNKLVKDSADILNAKTDVAVPVDIPDPDNNAINLKPLEKWAAAEATYSVRTDRVKTALEKVKEFTNDELVIAERTFVDTLKVAQSSLAETMTLIDNALVGDTPQSLTSAIDLMSGIGDAINALDADLDNATALSLAAKQQTVSDLSAIKTLIEGLETQLSTVTTDFSGETAALSFLTSFKTALAAVKTVIGDAVVQLNAGIAHNADVQGMDLDVLTSQEMLDAVSKPVNDAITEIGNINTALKNAFIALSNAHVGNTILSENAQDMTAQVANAAKINEFAGDLTSLWEGAFDIAENGSFELDGVTRKEDGRTHAEAAFKDVGKAEDIYEAYLQDEANAKAALIQALQDFKTASTAKYLADKDAAYAEAYYEVGRSVAIRRAETALHNQELTIDSALKEAIALAKEASAAVADARANSTDPDATQSVLDKFEDPLAATANDFIKRAADALAKGQDALDAAQRFNDPTYNLFSVKNNVNDLANRLTALENKFAALQKIVDTGGTFELLSTAATEYHDLAVAEAALAAYGTPNPGDPTYDGLVTARNNASTDATTADGNVDTAQNTEATNRVNSAGEVSDNAVTQAGQWQTDAQAVVADATVSTALSNDAALNTNVQAALSNLQTAVNAVTTADLAVNAAQADFTDATTPAEKLEIADTAESAAAATVSALQSVGSAAKQVSTVIVEWASAIITAQLTIAEDAKAAALAAEAALQAAYNQINITGITPANVTQANVDTLTSLLNTITTQKAIAVAKAAEAAAAYTLADDAQAVAIAGAGDHSEFAVNLQIFADKVGLAKQAASVADNSSQVSNTNFESATLTKTLVSTMLEVREIREAAEAAAQEAADTAAQNAADQIAAEEAAQAVAAQNALTVAQGHAEIAAQKAALAEQYALAAEKAAINANLVEATAQYNLALEASQAADASAQAAADAAAGHGAAPLAYVTQATESATSAKSSLAIAEAAKNTAANSAAAADTWRDGSASSNIVTTEAALKAVTVTKDLVGEATNNATAALDAVNLAKYGNGTTKIGAIDLRIAAEAAKGAWESQIASETAAIERLLVEMTNRGNGTSYTVADINALADLSTVVIDTDGSNPAQSADELILGVWLDALKSARAAKENAETAYNSANSAATAAENEVTVAENEASLALQAATDAANLVANLIAKSAAAGVSETLGRLAADLQAESTVDDVLAVMKASAASLNDSTVTTDASDVINSQLSALNALSQIAGTDLSATNLTTAQAAYAQMQSALASALVAKNNSIAALQKITTDFDANSTNGQTPAIEQFYVLKSGLPGTPRVGELGSYNTTDHDWVHVGGGTTYVIHVNSVAKYQSVLQSITLAEKQAAQILSVYNGLAAKVDEAAQTLSQIESAYQEANFAEVNEIDSKFASYVEKAEGATEKAVDSADAALNSAKNAIAKVIALAGGEIDGSNVVTIDDVQHTELTNAYQKLVAVVGQSSSLVNVVDGWTAENNDPADAAEISQLISDIDAALNALGATVTSLTGNVSNNAYAADAAVFADAAAADAKAALLAAKAAASNLLDINDNSINTSGTLEDALIQVAPANDAVIQAQTAAQKAALAAGNDNSIALIQEAQAQEAAATAAEAARQADYDAVVAAQNSAASIATDARADATAAKLAYTAALAVYTVAQTKAASAKALVTALDGGRSYTDLQTKSALEQANRNAQNALGDTGSTPDAQNVASELAKAKAAWLAATANANAAETAYSAIQNALTNATTAFNGGQSVSQYRQTAETNLKTLNDQTAAADKSRISAESANTNATTAGNRVTQQADIAAQKNAVLSVSESIVDYKKAIAQAINGDGANVDGAQADLTSLKTAKSNAIAQSQIASSNVDAAVQDMVDNPSANPVDQLADELAAATQARDLALQYRGTPGVDGVDPNAAEELDELIAAYSQAESAVIAARAVVAAAGSNANSVAQAQLAEAETLFTKISGLKAEAEKAYSEANAAYQEAEASVTALTKFINAEISAAEARQQAIDSVESEADQAYQTALQTSQRAQTVSDEISNGSSGVYDKAAGLLANLQTTLQNWLTTEQGLPGDGNYSATVESQITTLLDRINNDNNDLAVQLDLAKSNIDSAYDAIFDPSTGYLQKTQDAADVIPTDNGVKPDTSNATSSLEHAQAWAQEAANQAQNVENETTKIEAQRSLFDGLYNDIKSVEESFNQVIAQADAENALAQAQAEANATPIAHDDTITGVNEDQPSGVLIDLFGANGGSADARQDGSYNDLVLVSVEQPAHGTVIILQPGDLGYDAGMPGLVRYYADPDYNGVDTFTYTMSNGGVDQNGNPLSIVKYSSAQVTITIAAVNDAPIITNTSIQPVITSVAEDTAEPSGMLVSDILSQLNISNVDGDALGIAIVDAPNANGVWQYYRTANSQWTDMSGVNESSAKLLDGSSLIRFVPSANHVGTETIQFRVWDGTAGTNQEVYDIGANGGTGGETAFSTAIVSANIAVTPVNDLPTITPLALNGTEDTPITFTLNDLKLQVSDIDGDTVTIDQVGGVSLATLEAGSQTLANGVLSYNKVTQTFTYTPSTDINGLQSVSFTAISGPDSITSSIDVTLAPVNDIPSVTPLLVSGDEDTAITFTLNDLIAEVDDVDGDSVTITQVAGVDLVTLDATDQTLTDGVLSYDAGTGTFTFTPNTDYSGNFTIAFDGTSGSDPINSVIDVTVAPVNDLPTIVPIGHGNVEDTPISFTLADVIAQVVDVDGDLVTIDQVAGVDLATLDTTDQTLADGVLSYDAGTETFTFTPNADYNGSLSIGFDATSGADPISGTIDLTFAPVNDLPTITPLVVTGAEDTPITFTLNDLKAQVCDVDGDLVTINLVEGVDLVTLDTTDQNLTDGVLSYDAGTETFTFTPNTDYQGNFTITFDGTSGSDPINSTIDVTVTPANDLPTATPVVRNLAEDGQINITLSELRDQIIDADGDIVNITHVAGVDLATLDATDQTLSEGVLSYDAGTETLIFTPNANFNGTLSISFDAVSGVDPISSSIDLTVNPVNDLPTVTPLFVTVDEDTPLSFTLNDLKAQVDDADGDLITINLVAGVDLATLDATDQNLNDGVLSYDAGTETFTFTPNANFGGNFIIAFDGYSGSDPINSTVDVTVTPVNDLPSVTPLALNVAEDNPINFTLNDLKGQIIDLDGDLVSITQVAGVDLATLDATDQVLSEGILSYDSGSEMFSFFPNPNYNGTFSISFEATSGLDPIVSTIDLTVDPVADAPIIQGIIDQNVAVEFDGVNDYIMMGRGNNESLAISGDLTIESWVKVDDLAKTNTLVSMSGDPASATALENALYTITVEAGGDVTYSHEYGNGSIYSVTFDANLLEGEWAQVSLVRDNAGGEVSLFVNGTEVSAIAGSNGSAPFDTYLPGTQAPSDGENAELTLGATAPLGDGSNYFSGEVAEVRIWSQARNDVEIKDFSGRTLSAPGSEPNLKAYWRFTDINDDKEYVADFSQSGNHIRAYDGLYFDGVDDKATTTSPLSLSSHSVSANVLFDGTSDGTLFSMNDGNGNTINLIATANGGVMVAINGVNGLHTWEMDATSNPEYSLADGQWHHVAYSFDSVGGNLYLHIDSLNVPVTQTNTADVSNFSIDSDITFGAGSTNTQFFEGILSDVSVFSQALTSADMTTLYEQGPWDLAFAPTAMWHFDDGVDDIIHAENNSLDMDAIISGMTSGAETWTNSLPSVHNYSGTYVDLTPANAISLGDINPTGNLLTLSAWVKPEFTGTSQTLFKLGNELLVEFTPSGELLVDFGPGSVYLQTANNIDFGEWMNLSVVFDGYSIKAYVDGEEVGYATGEYGFSAPYTSFVGQNFDSPIGEFQIWDRVLSDTEINTYMHGGLDGSESGLIAYVPMNEGSGTTLADVAGNLSVSIAGTPEWQPALPELVGSLNINMLEDEVFMSRLVADDGDGDALTYSIQTNAVSGVAVINADGTLTYTPNTNFSGSDSFVVRVSDGTLTTDQTINVTIADHNAEPQAQFDYFEGKQDESILITSSSLLSNDTDQDGDNLMVLNVFGAQNGSIVDNLDGTWTYTPHTGFYGSDYLNYTVSDGNGGFETGYFDINITPVTYIGGTDGDDPSLIGDDGDNIIDGLGGSDTMTGSSGEDVFFFAGSVDSNVISTDVITDFEIGVDKIELEGAVGYSVFIDYTFTTDVATTISNINGDPGVNEQSVVTFTDSTYRYVYVKDAGGDYDNFLLTVANNAAISAGDFALSAAPVEHLATASPSEILTGAAGVKDAFVFDGAADSANDGSYDTISNFTSGEDFIRLDGASGLTFWGIAPNLGTYTTAIATINGDNGTYPDGSLVVFTDGTDTWLYAKVVSGPYSNFLVKVEGLPNITLSDIDFNDAGSGNTPPIGNDDAVSTAIDTLISFNVLTNDSDSENDTLSVTEINGVAVAPSTPTAVANGSVTIYAGGTIDFTPSAGFSGQTSFTYTVSDGNGGTDVATVNINVGGVTYSPVIGTDGDDPNLIGGTGNDILDGLGGSDTMTGGAGSDIFFFAGSVDSNTTSTDVITDFEIGVDKIELEGALGYSVVVDHPFTTDVATTIAHINGDIDQVVAQQSVVTFTDGTYRYVYVKDAGGDYDNFLLTLANNVAISPSDFALSAAPVEHLATASPSEILTGAAGVKDAFVFDGAANSANDGTYDTISNFTSGEDFIRLDGASGLTFWGIAPNLGTYTTAIATINGDNGTYPDGSLVVFTDGTDTWLYAKVVSGPYSNFLVKVEGLPNIVATDIDFNDGGSGNTPPIGNDDAVSTAIDTLISFNVLTNDSDSENDTLSVTEINGVAVAPSTPTAVANGSVTIYAGGTIDFTPSAGFSGQTSFTYTVSDGNGGTDVATVNINVGGVGNQGTYGGQFGDMLVGTAGADEIEGAGGADTLTGNGGSDIFVYSNSAESNTTVTDVITDFALDDKIQLIGGTGFGFNLGYLNNVSDVAATISTIEGDTNIANGTVVTFDDGSSTFVYIKNNSGDYYLEFNEFGSPFLVELQGVLALTASNFDLIDSPTIHTGTAAGETLTGDAGDDIFIPMSGLDSMTGGGGENTYVFYGSGDTNSVTQNNITDFNPANDEIVLKGGQHLTYYGHDSGSYATIADAITAIIGNASISNNSIVTFNQSSNTYVYVKTDNPYDPYNDFLLALNGGPALSIDNIFTEYTENTIAGTSGNDSALQTTGHDDVIIGYDGDDTIAGMGGDDVILGGAGNDVASFEGLSSGYEITQLGAEITVRDTNLADGNEGEDILIDVETVYFNGNGNPADQRAYTISQEGDVLVNTTTTDVQESSDIAGLAFGGYVIVYSGINSSTSDNEVYFRVYDDEGNGGAEVMFSAMPSANLNGNARVAALQNGGFVITWTQEVSVGNTSVYGIVYDATGTADTNFGGGTGFVIGTTTQGSDLVQIRVAGLEDGGFVAAWAKDGDIVFKRYDAEGTSGSETIVANTANAEGGVEVVGLLNGGYALIWQEIIGDDVSVRMSVYSNNDTLLAGNILLDDNAYNDVLSRDISVLQNGNILVTWTADQNGDGKPDAVAAIYDATGTVVSPPFIVDYENQYVTTNSAVTALDNGTFVVVWRADGQDGDLGGIFGKIFNSDGSEVTDMFLINTLTANDQTLPRVSAFQGFEGFENGFVVTWTGDDGSGTGIYKKVFNNDGTVSGGLTITGTSGDDVIYGGEGEQHFNGLAGNDTIFGGEGNDLFLGGAGNDTLDGGNSVDAVSYENNTTDGVTVDLSSGTATSVESGNDTLISIESVRGTSFADTLIGSAGDDFFDGKGGDDTINAGDGDDYIWASVGNDVINGGSGNDYLSFDTDFSTLGVTVDLSIVGDGAGGGTGDQLISAEFGTYDITGIENVHGTIGNDTLTGDSANNVLTGLEGNDTLNGNGGDDLLIGDMGNDVLDGGDGYDLLIGGDGADTLTGGLGADNFVFKHWGDLFDGGTNTGDIITDFEVGTDKLSFNKFGFDNLSALSDGTITGLNFADQSGSGVVVPDSGLLNNGPTFIFVDDTDNPGDATSLYFDADGSGSAYQSTKVAEFSDGAVITANDIILTST